MDKSIDLQEFKAEVMDRIPENLKTGIGHFNVFRLDEFAGKKQKPMPYRRKDYFKISLIIGNSRVHYADKIITIQNQGILFANPQIPYNWEQLDETLSGYFCVFTKSFFDQSPQFQQYPVFQPKGDPVYTLNNDQLTIFSSIFKNMLREIEHDFTYKYDVLRNLVFNLIHEALRLQPAHRLENQHSNASQRITTLFMDLLERQFPIESLGQRVVLRSPSDFAKQLNIHVNHLNRALKENTRQVTSRLIGERMVKEAKILLRHTNWSIAEMAFTLGFDETAHFSNHFKRFTGMSPSAYRKKDNV